MIEELLKDVAEMYKMRKQHEDIHNHYLRSEDDENHLGYTRQREYFDRLDLERENYDYYIGLVRDVLEDTDVEIDLNRINEFKNDFLNSWNRVEQMGVK